MNKLQRSLILDWMRKIHLLEHAHRQESIFYARVNTCIGITILILSAYVSVGFGIDRLKNDPCLENTIIISSISVPILTGILTLLRPAELSEKHRLYSGIYEELRHKIEYHLANDFNTFLSMNEWELKHGVDVVEFGMEKIRNEWKNIEPLNISNRNFKKGRGFVSKLSRYSQEPSFNES